MGCDWWISVLRAYSFPGLLVDAAIIIDGSDSIEAFITD